MSYRKEIFRQAEQTLAARRSQAQANAALCRQEAYLRVPELEQIAQTLSSTGAKAARILLEREQVREKLTELKAFTLSLTEKKKNLLLTNGFAADFLDVHYTCPSCNDTGYIDGKMCACMRKLLRDITYAELSAEAPLQASDFAGFSLEYYPEKAADGSSPRAQMSTIYRFAQKYAADFTPHARSILFTGRTGLGKTHLSLAVAGEVIAKGYGVIYGSAQNLASRLEHEHFSNTDEPTLQNLLDCDLLIVDDLGTEFSSAYSNAALYTIINTRLLRDKPVIVSTNLSLKELHERYGERLVSRMIGSYVTLQFVGRDIRQLKR